jgi:hypothetical protein
MRGTPSTAAALFALAGAIVVHGLLTSSSSTLAIAAAPVARAEPTVVGFAASSVSSGNGFVGAHFLWRLWSDGTVERRFAGTSQLIIGQTGYCSDQSYTCAQGEGGWMEIPGTGEGFACAPDVNGDRVVDGADLSLVLGAWGVAQCDPVPPIDCTLGRVAGAN